jgi:K+-transporting ATPase ATPase C chain
MNKQIKVSFLFTLLATAGLGIIYPIVVTSVGLVIPSVSSTAFLEYPIQTEDLFHGRPSMSSGTYSGASNLSLTNPELWKQVDQRLKEISKYPPKGALVPRDLLFASASGYDPNISIQAAFHQIPRIARTRNIDMNILRQLVDQHTQSKFLGFVGTEQVNVIKLNNALEILAKSTVFAEPGMFRIGRSPQR